jgi:PAS domain S-box-containing protein
MSKKQNELLTEKQKFEALFQYASLGILVVNELGEIILANSFLLSQFNYDSADELIGRKIEILIPSRYHKRHVGDRQGYTANSEKRPMGLGMDLFGIKKDGIEFPLEVSLSNYQTEQGNFVIAFVSDISRRKEIERAFLDQQNELAATNLKIEELNDSLELKVEKRTLQLQDTLNQLQESKNELTKALGKEKELGDLKSRFVSMASHEFRTPLSTILSSASLVAKYVKGDEQEKRDKHIHRIKSAVNNLTDILNEFLSIGKIEDGKVTTHYSRFNIKELITTLLSEIKGIAKIGQRIVFVHEGETEVELDASMLKNIIINLLSNAIKFTQDNGQINVRSRVDVNHIKISVTDSGIGISEEDQHHLFERFFRGKNVTNIQGTGLGLHIVGKYVELMDGQIECISNLEKGTTFNVIFRCIDHHESNLNEII